MTTCISLVKKITEAYYNALSAQEDAKKNLVEAMRKQEEETTDKFGNELQERNSMVEESKSKDIAAAKEAHNKGMSLIKSQHDKEMALIDETENAKKASIDEWSNHEKQKLNEGLEAKKAIWEKEEQERIARIDEHLKNQRNKAIISSGNKPSLPANGPKGKDAKNIEIARFQQDAGANFGDINVKVEGGESLSPEEIAKQVRGGIKAELSNVAEKLRRRAGGGTNSPISIGGLSSN